MHAPDTVWEYYGFRLNDLIILWNLSDFDTFKAEKRGTTNGKRNRVIVVLLPLHTVPFSICCSAFFGLDSIKITQVPQDDKII